MPNILSVDEVRAYLEDYPEVNLLLDKEEFSNAKIQLCISLGADEYNNMPPKGGYTLENFPSKSILLQGTLWQLFQSKAAIAVRNHMSYSDGGIQIPIEEKYEMWASLANTHKASFVESASKLKIHENMQAGWGSVSSDESYFPIW